MKPTKKPKAPWTQAYPDQAAKLRPENTKAGGVKAMSGGETQRYKVYRAIAILFKNAHPFCESPADIPCECTIVTDEVHHKSGRDGLLLFDIRHFIPLCSSCHTWIHQHPEEAIKLNLLADKGQWRKTQ
jgi:hypothetical protein